MKVLLVSEEALVRRALAGVVAAYVEGAEVTQVGRADEANEILGRSPHDVALADIRTPRKDGLKLLLEIRSAWPDLPVIILSANDDAEAVSAALAAGAAGYVLKDASPEDLATAVRVARSGSGNMISARAARNLPSAGEHIGGKAQVQSAVRAAGLTRREVDVLGLLIGGATNRQISRLLFLSEKTVKAHLASAFRRLGVGNRTQAAVAAVAMGIAGSIAGQKRVAGADPTPGLPRAS